MTNVRDAIKRSITEASIRCKSAWTVIDEKNEYIGGHIPGAVNEPLSVINRTTLPKDRPLFLYCLRGTRSKKAAGILKKLGYGQVKNIGGIAGYHGDLER